MSTLKKIFCILTFSIISLCAHAGEVTFGGVTWDEELGSPLSASFTFNQWYTTDSSDFESMDVLALPIDEDDFDVNLFAFGEFTGFSSDREGYPSDNTTFTSGAELTFVLTGAFWNPLHDDADDVGLVTSSALLSIYIDETRDLHATDWTDWPDANNDGLLWASFSFGYSELTGTVNDAQLTAGLNFVDSAFAGSEVLDTHDGMADFLLNSSAIFNMFNVINGDEEVGVGVLAQGANGQIIRNISNIPEPSMLTLFALGLLGLASRRFVK